MDIKKILNERYSTKKFDENKKISNEILENIKKLLQLSASSVNLQPWHFIITETKEGKEKIAKSTEGMFEFNKEKILTASHVVVFTSKKDISEEYLQKLVNKEEEDGRFLKKEIKEKSDIGRRTFVNIHKENLNDLQDWIDKQVYLNIGSFLLGVGAIGVDAVPMEGFDEGILEKELGLIEKGLKAVAIVPIGYRAEEDFNSKLPKSRLEQKDIITTI